MGTKLLAREDIKNERERVTEREREIFREREIINSQNSTKIMRDKKNKILAQTLI